MKLTSKNGVLILLVLAAAFSRLIPHAPNVTPLGAIALFGAAYFSRKWMAFLVPALAMFISSLYINNVVFTADSFVWFDVNFPAQVLSFALIGWMGMSTLKEVKGKSLLFSSISASLIFFIVSNFSTWLTDGMYPMTAGGLITCYEMAIPYFWNTLLGDAFYTGVIFGAFALIRRQVPTLSHA
ncbi:MAG: hypothetical protein LPK45_04100 [Bacteroidota bacterium]|nr:hypothetical protein [Bacteroidota bacterium]MDX5430235.1 hypothetical protein [Bacteroidota bacterium]MDX5468996.1 hypothetical protein [Bacteroidota bacterium]